MRAGVFHSISVQVKRLIFLLGLLFSSGCTVAGVANPQPQPVIAANPLIKHDHYSYKIVKQYPHNSESFTQGLVYHQGILLETTGLRKKSRLMAVELSTGKALKSHKLDDKYFGEGMTVLNNRIYQVTLDARKGFIYDLQTLKPTGSFAIKVDGWGLTNNGKHLILSDGSANLYFIDPMDFSVQRTLEVFDDYGTVRHLNELEFVDGLILANLWYTDRIVAIDQRSGKIISTIDIKGLSPSEDVNDVSNGIAWDKQNNRLFLTGKRWSALYEIQLVPKSFAKPL